MTSHYSSPAVATLNTQVASQPPHRESLLLHAWSDYGDAAVLLILDGRLVCFQFWAIKNKSATFVYKSLCGQTFSFLLGKSTGVGLLGPMQVYMRLYRL